MATKSPPKLVKLDGRTLEGGGQLLRIALGLSALTGTPIEIDHIRGARSGGGGLKAQHLCCVSWLAKACNAKTTGAQKGSTTLLFEPGSLDSISPAYRKTSIDAEPAAYETVVDIGSVGSTGLVLQAILPYILFAPPTTDSPIHFKLTLIGGTNVSGSPSYEYISQVLLPTLEGIGLPKMTTSLLSRGWSQGRATPGSFTLEFSTSKPASLAAFRLRPRNVKDLPHPMRRGPHLPKLQVTFLGPQHSHATFRDKLMPHMQQHFVDGYAEESERLIINCEDSADDKRLYLIIVATMQRGEQHYRLAQDWLYDKKVHSVDRAVSDMCKTVTRNIFIEWYSGAWVDEHMRDQLVIFQALANGVSSVWPGIERSPADGDVREPSLHARTAEWVSKEMLGVNFTANDECQGIGFNVRKLEDRLAGLQI